MELSPLVAKILAGMKKREQWPLGLIKTVNTRRQIATAVHRKPDIDFAILKRGAEAYKHGTPSLSIGEQVSRDESGKFVCLVPVYRGIDGRIAKEMRYQQRRFITGKRVSKFWENAFKANKELVMQRRMAQIASKLPFGNKAA